jgi:hypothetical protein
MSRASPAFLHARHAQTVTTRNIRGAPITTPKATIAYHDICACKTHHIDRPPRKSPSGGVIICPSGRARAPVNDVLADTARQNRNCNTGEQCVRVAL